MMTDHLEAQTLSGRSIGKPMMDLGGRTLTTEADAVGESGLEPESGRQGEGGGGDSVVQPRGAEVQRFDNCEDMRCGIGSAMLERFQVKALCLRGIQGSHTPLSVKMLACCIRWALANHENVL